jgi:uncharacterized membrane protein (DUF373 family)
MPPEKQTDIHPARRAVVRSFLIVEDVVYIGLAALLAISALALLAGAFANTFQSLWNRSLGTQIVVLLDQILLVLLIIELLYTVQVSFREHRLLAEPFVVVALIAAIRRVLVITAEISKVAESNEVTFRHAVWELALLTGMILVFVGSLIMLQKQTRNREP